jgi:hypothetical protein
MNHPLPELGKTLLQQAEELLAAAEAAYMSSNTEAGEHLDAEAFRLEEQNEMRIASAKYGLSSYSLEVQEAGEDNAGSTFPWCDYPHSSFRYAEYWELAERSAECFDCD